MSETPKTYKLSKSVDPEHKYSVKDLGESYEVRLRETNELVACHAKNGHMSSVPYKPGSFKANLIEEVTKNSKFRKILYTVSGLIQLVAMSLEPGQEIGMEVHPKTAQFVYLVKGSLMSDVNGEKDTMKVGSMVVVNPNTRHNFTNMSTSERAKLFVIYSPPEHSEYE